MTYFPAISVQARFQSLSLPPPSSSKTSLFFFVFFYRFPPYSRPKKLNDVAYQEEVVDALRNTLKSGDLPHLLFYGPPGTGKTSTILAVARELFGPDIIRSRVLELNASHERGIDVIREKVKTFAQIAVGRHEGDAEHPCPPFKIVILDEADCMTRDAQSALRRVMENYAKVTRFCVICNYVSKIIEPITSRCAKFRYKPLAAEAMRGRLMHICEKEGIKTSVDAIDLLIKVSHGDMRRSITLLQTAHALVGTFDGSEDSDNPGLTEDIIHEVAGSVPETIAESLITSIKTSLYSEIEKAAKNVVMQGYSADAVLQQLLKVVIDSNELDDEGKAQVAIRIADAETKLIEGADETLQMIDVLSVLMAAYSTHSNM